MRKITLISVLVLFLCILSGSALAVLVHEGWHEYADVFTVDGKVIDIRLSESGTSPLRVKVDNASGLIEYKKCREYGIYTVCFLNYSMDVDQVTISNTGKTMPGVQININKVDAVLTDLTATPKLTKFYINEEYRVNVTIKNAKSEWINLFNYELTLPGDVQIVNQGDFVVRPGNKLSYTGTMTPNSEKVVSFTVKSQISGAKIINYNMSLETDLVTKEAKGTFSLDVANPYEATVTLTPESINVFETSKLVFLVKNSGNYDLELSNITFSGPTGDLNYYAGRGLEINRPGVFSLSQKEFLKKENDKEYYMVITPYVLGRYDFNIRIDMKYNGKNIAYSINKSLISSANGFTPVFDLSKDAVLSGSDVEVYYELVNTNADAVFNGVSVDITGDFVSEHLTLDKLNAPDSRVLLRKFIDVPYVDQDKNYRITAVTTYFTQSGERKQVNLSKDLKVTSNGSLISIRQSASPVEVYPGQEVIVEVTVTNLKDEVFVIDASETIPQGIEKIGGIVLRNFTLRGLGSDSAYIYKLFVPLDTSLTGFNVTAIGRVGLKNYEVSTSSYIKIRKNLSSTNSGTGAGTGSGATGTGSGSGTGSGTTGTGSGIVSENSSGTGSPENITVIDDSKKESGFRKFFKNIEKFFTNLFS